MQEEKKKKKKKKKNMDPFCTLLVARLPSSLKAKKGQIMLNSLGLRGRNTLRIQNTFEIYVLDASRIASAKALFC